MSKVFNTRATRVRGGTGYESLIGVTLVALAGLGGLGVLGVGYERAIVDGGDAPQRGAASMAVSTQAGLEMFGHGAEVARATGLVPPLDGVVDLGRAVETAAGDAAGAAAHLETPTMRGALVSEGNLAAGVSRRAVNALRHAIGDRAFPAIERAMGADNVLHARTLDRFEAVVRPGRTGGAELDLVGFARGESRAAFRGGPYRTLFGNDAVGVVAHNGAPIFVRLPKQEGRTLGAELRRLVAELRQADHKDSVALNLNFRRTENGKFEFTTGTLQGPVAGDITLLP